MITVTVELSLDTAAKLAHCAGEHKRAVVDEALFICREAVEILQYKLVNYPRPTQLNQKVAA